VTRAKTIYIPSLQFRRIWRPAASAVMLAFVGCAAAPPLRLYTLSQGPTSNDTSMSATAVTSAPPQGAPVLEVARVTLPDYLDSRDLVIREGNSLHRSSTGRWASRLSLAATELLTTQLAARRTDAWVTDQPQSRAPGYRLRVHVSQLDITSTGTGTLSADWEAIPLNLSGEILRGKTRFTLNGSVATDQDVARFERELFVRLAGEIDVSSLSSSASTHSDCTYAGPRHCESQTMR
jgi:uncharacterized protein